MTAIGTPTPRTGRVLDAYGNVATGYRGSVHLGSQALTLTDTANAPFSAPTL